MRFNPNTGQLMLSQYSTQEFSDKFPHLEWRFDPWTGTSREPRYWHIQTETAASTPAAPEEIAEGQAWVESLRAASTPSTPTAPDILTAAAKHIAARAKTYDKPGGERSMGQTVTAFNAITGRDLKESEGWLLMQILKDVRDRQCEDPHDDSLEDCVAYAALKAEARMGGR